MISRIGSPDAKHRWVALLYITSLLLSWSRTVVAPPERSFDQGQPELPQTMDNYSGRKDQPLKRHLSFQLEDIQGYPAQLTHKTSSLLSEAEQMIQHVKNLGERQWLESFIQRLKLFSSGHVENNTAQEPLVTRKASVEKHLLRLGNPINQSEDLTSSTPETIIPETKIDPKSNDQATKLNQVSEIKAEEKEIVFTSKQQIPKPLYEEEDEMVRELHELSAANTMHNIPNTSPETPLKRMISNQENDIATQIEISKLKQDLINDVDKLEKLGETQEDILHTLHLDYHKSKGFIGPKNFPPPNPFSMKTGTFQSANNIFKNNMQFSRVGEANKNDQIASGTNHPFWKPTVAVHPFPQPARPFFMNNTISEMHQNHPMMNQGVQHYQRFSPPAVYNQAYFDGIRDTLQRLNKQHQMFIKDQVDTLHLSQNNREEELYDDDKTSRDRHPEPENGFPQYAIQKQAYNAQGKDTQITALQTFQPMISPFKSNPIPSHKIDDELSDDMRRQLRDGKVILLSDSVVRSNFNPPFNYKNNQGGPPEKRGKDDNNSTQV